MKYSEIDITFLSLLVRNVLINFPQKNDKFDQKSNLKSLIRPVLNYKKTPLIKNIPSANNSVGRITILGVLINKNR